MNIFKSNIVLYGASRIKNNLKRFQSINKNGLHLNLMKAHFTYVFLHFANFIHMPDTLKNIENMFIALFESNNIYIPDVSEFP